MNATNMPGFTAEVSLFQRNGYYFSVNVASHTHRKDGVVIPQRFKRPRITVIPGLDFWQPMSDCESACTHDCLVGGGGVSDCSLACNYHCNEPLTKTYQV